MTTQNALNTAQFPSTPGSAGNLIRSNGTKYTNTTLTFPDTTTANQLLYSSATNTVGGLATAANGVLVTSGSSVPSISSTLPAAVQSNITTTGTITSGTWNGSVIGLAYGGTNANLTASNGGIFYSTGSAGAILSGTATANQVLLSGSSTTPAWSTTTWPATSTINRILYSSATNTISEITAANQSVLCSNGSGVPSWVNLSSGNVLIGTSSGLPASSGMIGGSGISISNSSGSITIAALTSGSNWTTVTGTASNTNVLSSYITNNAGLVTLTLPANFAVGDSIRVIGFGAGGWRVQANTGDIIHYGSQVTSAAGSLSSAGQYDTLWLFGVVANTEWTVMCSSSAGLTVA